MNHEPKSVVNEVEEMMLDESQKTKKSSRHASVLELGTI